MNAERQGNKRASIGLALPIILFTIGLISPSDVLDRLWFGSEYREMVAEWAPWTVYRANRSEFSQVALLIGGVCTFLLLPQTIILLFLFDLRRSNGGVMPFMEWLKLVAVASFLLIAGVVFYFYPTPMDATVYTNMQERSRFYASFLEAAILFVMPCCVAMLLHAFVIYPATVFAFKKK